MIEQKLEDVYVRLSADYLDEMTTLFSLEGFDKNIDPETVAVVRSRVNTYLKTWILPKIEKVIDELK